MNVAIVEDDDLMADLIKSVVATIRPDLPVSTAASIAEARTLFRDQKPVLVVLDWNLPDGSGVDLLKEIRTTDRELPVFMVTGKADRQSILQAAHYGLSGYIGKPFDVETLHARLAKVLTEKVPQDIAVSTCEQHLEEALNSGTQIPAPMNIAELLELIGRVDEVAGSELAERWKNETALCAKLLDVANRSSMRHSGKSLATVRDAISMMGVPMALSQALALALGAGSSLKNPALKNQADTYQQLSEAVAATAQQLAQALEKKPLIFYTAGLLSRLGELAVLHVMDQFVKRGGYFEENEIQRLLNDYSTRYGNQLKIQWHLPIELRQKIGAVHALARDNVKQELLIMRTAGLLAEGQESSSECKRNLRLLGLEDWQSS